MPLFHLDTVADVSIVDWSVYGTSVPAYQAIRKDSGDSSGVQASLLNASAIFQCNHGTFPAAGLVGPFRVFCRYRLSDPAAVGASLFFSFRVGGVDKAVGVVAPTGAWTTSSAEHRKDGGTTRATLANLQNLTLRLLVVAPPSSGTIEVSEIWLEEETAEGIYKYDSAEAVLPDAVVGPLQWTTIGAQPVAIVVPGSNFLQIFDSSLVDYRLYLLTVTPAILKPGCSTQLETRILFPAFISLDGTMYIPLAYQDGERSVMLSVFKQGATYYLGLTSIGADPDDPASYLALEPLPSALATNVWYHLRMRIRRSLDLSSLGLVEVFLDHALTPILSVPYASFDLLPLAACAWFSTWANHAFVWIDYVTFQTVREFGAAFQHWDQMEGDADCVVSADSTDSGICKLTPLKLLPDVVAGQSNYACKLSAGAAAVGPCSVSQLCLCDSAYDYTLSVEYRDDIAAAAPLRVTIQRISDLWYYDPIADAWAAAPAFTDLAHSATRTSVQVNPVPFSVPGQTSVLITLEYNFTGPPALSNVWLYRVYLERI